MWRKFMIGTVLAAGVAGTVGWATGSLDFTAIANEARLVLGQGGAKDKARRPPAAPPAVTVVEAAPRSFVETLRVTGSLAARKEIMITPEVEGQRVAALLADAGDEVRAGQVLARLARENLDAQVAQNRAQLARAEAGIAQAEGAIAQTEARVGEADAALERAKPLARSGYLSESLLDQRQAAATSARAARAIARDSLRAAESEKAAAEARQRELDWRLARTEIRAPVDGLVLARDARVGQIAAAQGEAMFRIAAEGEIELHGAVPADDLARLVVGQEAQIAVGSVGAVKGEVRLIEPIVDARTRLGTVRIMIGADKRLRVGQFASGQIETRRGGGIGVPARAVMYDGDGAYVLAVAEGRIRMARIATGLAADGFVEVSEGLVAGDLVVARAGTFLADGDQITPVPPAEETQRKPARAQAKAG